MGEASKNRIRTLLVWGVFLGVVGLTVDFQWRRRSELEPRTGEDHSPTAADHGTARFATPPDRGQNHAGNAQRLALTPQERLTELEEEIYARAPLLKLCETSRGRPLEWFNEHYDAQIYGKYTTSPNAEETVRLQKQFERLQQALFALNSASLLTNATFVQLQQWYHSHFADFIRQRIAQSSNPLELLGLAGLPMPSETVKLYLADPSYENYVTLLLAGQPEAQRRADLLAKESGFPPELVEYAKAEQLYRMETSLNDLYIDAFTTEELQRLRNEVSNQPGGGN